MIDWSSVLTSLFIGLPTIGLGLLTYRNAKRGNQTTAQMVESDSNRGDFDSITREWKALAEQAKRDLTAANDARKAAEQRAESESAGRHAAEASAAAAEESAAQANTRVDALEHRFDVAVDYIRHIHARWGLDPVPPNPPDELVPPLSLTKPTT